MAYARVAGDTEGGIIFRSGALLRRNHFANTGEARVRNAMRIVRISDNMLKRLANANG
jgi:hypothetical protein